MAGEIGYTRGQTTFTAAEELEKHRLVRVKAGSITSPVEVEYTDSGFVMGVTDEPAEAGELVSIRPLNLEGTYEFTSASDTIAVGSPLFVNTDARDGRVTDTDTGYFVGQATEAGTENEVIEVGGVVGVIGAGAAEDISIDDSVFNYFTSDNVNGALQELGATLSQTDIVARQNVLYSLRTDPAFAPMDTSDIGGLLASDTDDIKLVVTNNVLHAQVYADGALLTVQGAYPPFFTGTNFDFGATLDTDSSDWEATYNVYVLKTDGTVDTFTGTGQSISATTGPTDTDIQTFGPMPSNGIGMTINIEFGNTVDPVANPLDVYSFYFKFNREVL